MQRRIGALLIAALLSLAMCFTASAVSDMTLTVKAPAGRQKAGTTCAVTIEISGNAGFSACNLTLAYNAAIAECTKITPGEMLAGALTAANPNAPDGARISATAAKDLQGDGLLAEFDFRMRKDGDPAFSVPTLRLSRADGTDILCKIATETIKPDPGTSAPPSGGGGGELPPVISGGDPAPVSFPDVKPGFWGEEWIVKAAERGLFTGDDKGNFRPDDRIIRGDYVLVLWRMAGKPEPTASASFADVPQDAYYAKAIAWAAEKGYVNGKGSGFAPRDSLTRQEAMKILYGYAGSPIGIERMLAPQYDSTFTDSAKIAPWAKDAMYWAYFEGIINGVSTTENALGPQMQATRAQLAKILVGYQDKLLREGT